MKMLHYVQKSIQPYSKLCIMQLIVFYTILDRLQEA